MTRVALVTLGRANANGEVRRVASWRRLWEHVGAEVDVIPLAHSRRVHTDGIRQVLAGQAVPERLAWSGQALLAEIERLDPDVVVCITARAYEPALRAHVPVVLLDFVDQLSRSYRDRSTIDRRALRSAAFRALSAAHARFERVDHVPTHLRIAAGRTDANALPATWVPNLWDPTLEPIERQPDRDVIFFGTLDYAPNVAAIARLERLWPLVLARRPGTTALIAGSRPSATVEEVCVRNGWELVRDYPSLAEVASRARIAVAPLDHTAGIQNKVLDAACLRLPQVVSGAAIAGFDAGFPLRGSVDDIEFADRIVGLLDDPDLAVSELQATLAHIREVYTPANWAAWADAALADARLRGLSSAQAGAAQ